MEESRTLELLQNCIDSIIEGSSSPLQDLYALGFSNEELIDLGFCEDLINEYDA